MKNIKKIFGFVPFVPILFSVSFVIILFNHNEGELLLSDIYSSIVIAIVFSLLVTLAATFFLRNQKKGLVFSSIFLITFFSYSEFLLFLSHVHIANLNLELSRIALPIILIFLLLVFFLLSKSKRSFRQFSLYLTIISVIVFLFPFYRLTKYEISRNLAIKPKSNLELSRVDISSLDKNKFPDIYYIVPDSYPSQDTYQKYFNFDNSSFTSFLQNKGFYVASQATSNYPKTFLSVPSTLNLEYLDYLSVNKNSKDQTITTPLIENNNVLHFLKSLGYRYYQMGSWWPPSHFNTYADENYIFENKNYGMIGDFNFMILESTMLKPFISRLIPEVTSGNSYERSILLYQFGELPQVAKLSGPKFVFAHIIAPHGPYVFGKNCEYTNYSQTKGNSEEQNYVNQTKCLNQKLEKIIDQIISESPKPPVILIQADEGANFLNARVKPKDSWKNASTDLMKEKFPILAAYYLPGKSKSSLYPSLTPVNSFREIFNLYFSANLPILPDKNYVFEDLKHLYKFTDVTQKIHQ